MTPAERLAHATAAERDARDQLAAAGESQTTATNPGAKELARMKTAQDEARATYQAAVRAHTEALNEWKASQ